NSSGNGALRSSSRVRLFCADEHGTRYKDTKIRTTYRFISFSPTFLVGAKACPPSSDTANPRADVQPAFQPKRAANRVARKPLERGGPPAPRLRAAPRLQSQWSNRFADRSSRCP